MTLLAFAEALERLRKLPPDRNGYPARTGDYVADKAIADLVLSGLLTYVDGEWKFAAVPEEET